MDYFKHNYHGFHLFLFTFYTATRKHKIKYVAHVTFLLDSAYQ